MNALKLRIYLINPSLVPSDAFWHSENGRKVQGPVVPDDLKI